MLVATDLFGRGMDIERVNIVFNYDMPESSDTYLHPVRQHIFENMLVTLLYPFPPRWLVQEDLILKACPSRL